MISGSGGGCARRKDRSPRRQCIRCVPLSWVAVLGNARIRSELTKKMREEMPDVTLRLPDAAVTTDNALMIAVAGFFRSTKKRISSSIVSELSGNPSL